MLIYPNRSWNPCTLYQHLKEFCNITFHTFSILKCVCPAGSVKTAGNCLQYLLFFFFFLFYLPEEAHRAKSIKNIKFHYDKYLPALPPRLFLYSHFTGHNLCWVVFELLLPFYRANNWMLYLILVYSFQVWIGLARKM